MLMDERLGHVDVITAAATKRMEELEEEARVARDDTKHLQVFSPSLAPRRPF